MYEQAGRVYVCVSRPAGCVYEQNGSVAFIFQALVRSLGLQLPVVVQSMYIFKVSSAASPHLSLPSVRQQTVHPQHHLTLGLEPPLELWLGCWEGMWSQPQAKVLGSA